jgi:hypothetical protein
MAIIVEAREAREKTAFRRFPASAEGPPESRQNPPSRPPPACSSCSMLTPAPPEESAEGESGDEPDLLVVSHASFRLRLIVGSAPLMRKRVWPSQFPS